jgi:hypothetical protein
MDKNGNGKLTGAWQGYTLTDGDGKPTDAAALFLAKFGYEPERVVKAGCILLAGPIGDNGRGPRQDAPEAGGGQVGAAGLAHRPASLAAQAEGAHVAMTPERALQLALSFEEVTR